MTTGRSSTKPDPQPSAKVRLVRVQIQFELVVDDGETLIPLGNILKDREGNPAVVGAVVDGVDWPTYASGRFLESMKELESKVQKVLET
jgi:hypothetical protein